MKTATLLAVVLAAASTVAVAESLPARQPQLLLSPANAIVGSWEFHARLFVCANGQTLQNLRASSLFNAGGTMLDTNTAPPDTRGPAFGTWTYDHQTGRYAVQMRLYRYNPDGSFAGVTQVERSLHLSSDGDSASGTFTGRILGPNEEVLAVACGEETGVRAL
jgi:hypothetical protein